MADDSDDAEVDSSQISVTVKGDGVVTLKGSVPTFMQKRAAELLHIKATTLNEMIKRYDIRPRRKRQPAPPGAPPESSAPDSASLADPVASVFEETEPAVSARS